MSKTRRPSPNRPGYQPFDPVLDPHPEGGTMGKVAFFEYREDALDAGREWVAPQGWEFYAQYVGRYDLWMLVARRKSWSSGKQILVEACLSPDVVVQRHAHVPLSWSFRKQEV